MPSISGFRQPNMPSWEFCAQGLNEAFRYCTTLRRNTHGTVDERELLYPWHRWAGQQVHIHEVIEKAGVTVFRCSLSGQASDRLLEAPNLMLDRTTCTNWHVMAAPHVNFTALRALAELLRDMGPHSHSQEMCAA